MFLIGILLVSIIFSIQPFLKKNLMNDFTIDEYTVYSSLIALIIFFIGSLYKGLDFKSLKDKSALSYAILIFISLLTLSYSYILNMLLKEYNVGDVMPYIRCGEMIWILLITGMIDFQDLNYKKILGVLLVICGIYTSSIQ
jgi:uncharacterized membrane protein